MTLPEIHAVLHEFRTAAANAARAGFDGVEIHGANGYLIHEFLSPTLNLRDDDYGGSPEGRARLLRETIAAIADVMPLARVGLRLSPFAEYNNVRDPNPDDTYGHVARWLDRIGLAYLHIADTNAWAGSPDYDRLIPLIRANYHGPLIVNGGITPAKAAEIVGHGDADAVAFGRLFLANPDLPERIRIGAPYNTPYSVGAYDGGDTGYLDYPTLDTSPQAASDA